MELLGEAALRDRLRLLPAGFWAAVGVWLRKPHVVNKRLCGAYLEAEVLRVARPCPAERDGRAGGGDGAPASALLREAWEAFLRFAHRDRENCERLGFAGPAGEELELLLRTLVPKSSPPGPALELVVKDIFNGIVTFLPLDQTVEGKHEIKKCNIYQIKLLHIQEDEWSVSVLASSPEHYISDGIVYPKTAWLGGELLLKLAKWSTTMATSEFKNTLSLISVARYSKMYQHLKEKYKKIVKVWPEVTDPEKFVFEDVAIAAYLLILWEDERAEKMLSKKQSFVDLGCGNGLLVHILSNEGHSGKGIDIRRRKIWDMYGPLTCLEESVVCPNSLFPDVDWLIGNHSDELTPWIPVIAARSSYSCRYFLLPCCFFDFHGKYNRRQSKKTQYREYLDFVREVGTVCGFNVEEDCLRIPSTKRVCLIGMSRTYVATQDSILDEQRAQYINSRRSSSPTTLPDKMNGLYQNGSSSVASDVTGLMPDATSSERRRDVGQDLISGFLPRGREQVRNCSTLPRDFVDKVILKVARLLLSETEDCPGGEFKTWNRGGSLALSEIVEHLDKDTLKKLKNEYGGLQTLLRNHHQVFEGPGSSLCPSPSPRTD